MITAIQWRGLSDPRVKQASDLTWESLPEWLAGLAEGVNSKAGCKCYSLVTLYDAAAGRGRKNTSYVHVVSLDFDAGAPPWGALAPYAYVAYTSPSHTVAAPRWRVHVRLAEPCPAGDYGATVRALLDVLGGPDVDSGASCDPARLWFSPLEDSDVRLNEGLSWGRMKLYGEDAELRSLHDAADAQREADERAIAAINADWPVGAVASHVAAVWGAGVRHPMARALGGYLARRGWTDDAILGVIAEQDSSEPEKRQAYALAAAERVRKGESAPGWDELVRMFGDVWADRLASLARHADEPADWAQSGIPWSAWWAKAAARLDAALARGRERDRLERAAEPPLLIGYKRDWWVRREAGGYHPAVPRENVIMMLRTEGHDYHDANGKRLSGTYICEEWGTAALSIEYRFGDSGISWDAERQAVVVGRELPVIEPVWNDAVDAWLHALFGEGYTAAEQWIAACAPRHINELTTCLVLVGAGSTGKSLIANVLAEMWGAELPVSLGDACVQFNAPILDCPVVLDDEATWAQKGQMSSQEFLERIQQRKRRVEPKGRDKQPLVGCQRVMITANDATAIRFRDVRGVETVRAAQSRLAWHANVDEAASKAALDRLRVGGRALLPLEVFKAHFAWLWANVVVDTAPRFIGAWDSAGAREAIMRDASERYSVVYDALREAAESGPAAAPYGHAIIVPGGPLDLKVGTILVSASELEKGLRDHRLPLWEIRRALEAVGGTPGGRHQVGKKRYSYWAVTLSNLP